MINKIYIAIENFTNTYPIFLCDLGGAAIGASGGGIGALAGGIWGSIMGGIAGGCTINPQDGNSLIVYDRVDDYYIADTEEDVGILRYDAVDSIGYLHNVIISEMYEELGDTIYTIDHEELLKLVCSKVEKYCGVIPADVMGQLPNVTQRAKLVADTFCDFSVENPYVALEEMLPDFKQEVNVLKNYGEVIDDLSTNAELVASYTREFRQIVDQAQIPVKSKELINKAVVVGGNSAVLWSEKAEVSTKPMDGLGAVVNKKGL